MDVLIYESVQDLSPTALSEVSTEKYLLVVPSMEEILLISKLTKKYELTIYEPITHGQFLSVKKYQGQEDMINGLAIIGLKEFLESLLQKKGFYIKSVEFRGDG